MKQLLYFLTTCVLSMCSCKNSTVPSKQNNFEKDTMRLRPIDSARVISLNEQTSPIVDSIQFEGKESFTGKGKLWRLWRKLHKNCQNSDVAKDMIYFGVSNTLGVGTVVLFDSTAKIFRAAYPMRREKFDQDQLSQIFNDGTASSCTFTQTTKVSTEFLVKSNLSNTSNAELNAAITNARTIDSKIDSWQQNHLFVDAFRTTVNRMTDDYSKDYIASLKQPARYVISSEIQIHGFSAIINTSTNINAELKAQLEKGIIEKIGDTQATVKYTYAGTTSIKVSTTGTFEVFGSLYQPSF